MPTSALSAAALLTVWEGGAARHPLDRALTLLQVVYPEESLEALASLSIGQRDRRLWAVRRASFGAQLEAMTLCPRCGEALECTLDADALCPPREAGLSPPREGAPGSALSQTFSWTDGQWALDFRLPDSRDLAAVLAAAPTGHDEGSRLATRLLVGVRRASAPVDPTDLPAPVLQRWQSHLASLDPVADIRLGLRCAACGHAWEEAFDIAGFLWAEVATEAARIFDEVHRLAAAYGWTESTILALSPARRAAYLARLDA